MEFDYSMLQRRIQEKYATDASFAREMGIPSASLRKKLRNQGDFTRGQMLKAAALLEIEPLAIPKYFFVERVQKSELSVGYIHGRVRRLQ